jgi:hypothetical protein
VSSVTESESASTIAVPSPLSTTSAITYATLAGDAPGESHRNRGRPATIADHPDKRNFQARLRAMGNLLVEHNPCRHLK